MSTIPSFVTRATWPLALLPLSIWLGACTAKLSNTGIAGSDPATAGLPGGSSSGAAGGSGSATPDTPGECNPVPTRIWKLSDSQYQRAVADLLPGVSVPAIQTPGRGRFAPVDYADELPVSGSMAALLRQTAKAVTAQAAGKLDALVTCRAAETQNTCAGRFVDEFTPRAWRRPLTAEDRTALLGVFQGGSADGFATGMRLVLEAILQSPSFLYRTELGDADATGPQVKLTPYELASSLSFFVLDSLPDATLWSHAQDGSLSNDGVWQQETERLLQLPRAQENLVHVLVRWLGAEQVLAAEVEDTSAFPKFEATREAMLQETRTFLAGLLAKQGTISELLTSRSTEMSPALASAYGLSLSGTDVQTVMLPAAQRSGILTQVGMIAGWPKLNRSVHRGLFIFRELLCGQVPSPPAGVNVVPPTGITTEREFAAYRAANSCQGCHGNFDPIGLSYENYDDFGQFITERDGAAVISNGTITLDAQPRNYANVVELGTLLANSSQVRQCVAQKLSSYAFGRRPSVEDSCVASQLAGSTAVDSPQLLQLFKSIALSSAFRHRNRSN